jgi:sugar phosphate isomerase/epimerase
MILQRVKQYGYDGIEWRGLGSEIAMFKVPEFTTLAAETLRKIEQAGLASAALDSSARIYDPTEEGRRAQLEEVTRYGKLCRDFNCRFLRVFGGALKGASPRQALALAAELLPRMADAVGPTVTIAVETHDEWAHTELLAEVLARVNLPNVRALWDLHHPFRHGGESPQQTYDNLKPWLAATHVKDSVVLPDGKLRHVLGGTGTIPLAEMLRLIKAGGYDGWVSVEWEKRWCPEIEDAEIALPAHEKWVRKVWG